MKEVLASLDRICWGSSVRADEVALPEDTGERIRDWAEGEQAKVELVGELSQAMQANGRDPAPIREAIGG